MSYVANPERNHEKHDTICDELEKYIEVQHLNEVRGAQVNMWNVSLNQELESDFQFCIQLAPFAPQDFGTLAPGYKVLIHVNTGHHCKKLLWWIPAQDIHILYIYTLFWYDEFTEVQTSDQGDFWA